MKLLPKAERRKILRKSYSIRWMVAGFVFTMAETFAGAMGSSLIPGPKWFGWLVISFIVAGAFVARLVAQHLMSGPPEGDSHVDSR